MATGAVTWRWGVKNYLFVSNVVCNVRDGAVRMFNCRQSDNTWIDNTFREGPVPRELLEAMQARAGLEPAYRRLCAKAPSATNANAVIKEGKK